jgi:hypothetical protein
VYEKPAGDIAAGHVGAPAAVDFFLFRYFLVDAWLSRFLWSADSRGQGKHDDQNGEASRCGRSFLDRRVVRAHQRAVSAVLTARAALKRVYVVSSQSSFALDCS